MLQPDKLKKLNENALKMSEAGSSQDEILAMKDAFIKQFGNSEPVKKKVSSQPPISTSTSQNGELETNNGSSGTPKMQTLQKDDKLYGDTSVKQPAQKLKPLSNTDKKIIANPSENYKKSIQERNASDELAFQKLYTTNPEAIQKGIADEENDSQVSDYLREGGKNVLNIAGGIINTFPKGLKAITGGAVDIPAIPKLEKKIPFESVQKEVDAEIEERKKNDKTYNPSQEEILDLKRQKFGEKLQNDQIKKNFEELFTPDNAGLTIESSSEKESLKNRLKIKQIDNIKNLDLSQKAISAEIQLHGQKGLELYDELKNDSALIQSGKADEATIRNYEQKLQNYNDTEEKYLKLLDEQSKVKNKKLTAEEHFEKFKLDYSPVTKVMDDLVSGFESTLGGVAYVAGNIKLVPTVGPNGVTELGNQLIDDANKRTQSHVQYELGDATSNPAGFIMQQATTLAPYIVGGEANVAKAIFIGSAMGKKKKEMDDEMRVDPNIDYSVKQQIGAMAMSGVAEGLMLGVYSKALKGLNPTIEAMSKTSIGRETLNNGFKDYAKRYINKVAPTLSESAKSASTGVAIASMHIYTDNAILGKKVENPYQQIVDSGVLFGGLHLGMQTGIKVFPKAVGEMVKIISSKTSQQEVKGNLSKIYKLSKELENPKLTDVEKTNLTTKIDAITKTNEKIINEQIDKVKDYTPNQVRELFNIDQEKFGLKKQAEEIKSGNYSKEYKETALNELKNKFNDAETRREAVFNNETNAIDILPLKEQDALKREALKQLTAEKNPDGTKNITIDNIEITKRALENYKKEQKSNNNQISEVNKDNGTEVVKEEIPNPNQIKNEQIQEPITNEVEKAQPQAEVKKTEQESVKTNQQERIIEYENGKGEKTTLNTKDIEFSFKDGKFLFSENGNRIGHIDISNQKGNEVNVILSGIFNPSLNRKGIGSIMYKEVAKFLKEKYNIDLVSDVERSKDSDALWKSLEREGLAIKEGEIYKYNYDGKNNGTSLSDGSIPIRDNAEVRKEEVDKLQSANDVKTSESKVEIAKEPTLEDITNFLNENFKKDESNNGTKDNSLQENSGVDKEQKLKNPSQRGKTPLDKRKIKDKEVISALKAEVYDAYSLAQQYFIGGGRILPNEVKSLINGSNSEAKARIGYTRTKEKKGSTIDQVAHSLWEEFGNELNLETSDFKEAIESVILDHVSTKSMAVDLNKRNGLNFDESKFDNGEFYQEAKDLGLLNHKEHNEAIGYLDVLTDAELIKLAEDKISFEEFLRNEEANLVTQNSKSADLKESINAEIDKVADAIKELLPGIKDKDIKTQGFSQDKIIDVIAEAVKALVSKGIDVNDAIRQVIDKLKEKFGELGIDESMVKERFNPKKTFERKEGKKSLLSRASQGNDKITKDAIEKYSLDYEIENQELAKQSAEKYVDEVGIENALSSVREGKIVGAEKAFVYNKIIEDITNNIQNVSESERGKLETMNTEILGEIFAEFDKESRNAGRFISALGKVYDGSNGRYNLSKQIQEFKALNNGVIPKDILEKFKEADAKIKELETKLAENEKIREEQQATRSIEEIIDAISRKTKYQRNQRIPDAVKAKAFADKLRSYKTTADKGNMLSASPLSLAYDGAIEIIATAIENGGKISDAIKKGVEHIRNQKLDKDEENKGIAHIFNAFDKAESVGKGIRIDDEGKLKIPHSILREKVESGIKNVDELVQSIKKDFENLYPEEEFTDRMVRDAITNYGKISNPTKEEIEVEISVMKSLGKLISGLEDVHSGKRPLRSGLQRRPLTLEERAMQRKLKDLLRDLPMEDADLAKSWKTALDSIKSRLTNEIADLDSQIEKGEKRKGEKKVIEYDQEANELKAIRDSKKQILDELVGKPELTEEEKIDKATILLEKSINKLQEQIDNNEIDYKKKPEPITSDKLTELRNTKKALQEQMNQMRQDAGLAEMKRLETAKKTRLNRINELNRRIKEKDFSVRSNKPLPIDAELLKIESELQHTKAIYEKEKYLKELEDRSWLRKRWSNIIQAIGITRLFKATGEFSQILVQQGFLTPEILVRQPKEFFKAMTMLGKSFASAEVAKRYEAEMKSHPLYPLMQKTKLSLTGTDHKLDAVEENFQIDLVNDTWNMIGEQINKATKNKEVFTFAGLVKKLLGKEIKNDDKKAVGDIVKDSALWKMFERGAVSYGNHIKIIKFEQGVRELQKDLKDPINNFEDYKKVANYINVFSGRANLGKAEMISQDASLFIFSLRNAVSQIQQLNPVFYYKLGNRQEMAKGKASVAQKMAVKSFMTSVTAITAFQVAFLALANSGKEDDEEKWKMELDPRSSDFMKLRRGKTTFDMWHGLNGIVVLMSRILSQQTKSLKSGEVKELGKGFGSPTTSDLLVNYSTNKLSPSAGYLWRLGNTHQEIDEKTGKSYRVDKFGNVYGQRETLDLFVPIYWGAINDIRKQNPDEYQAFLISLGLLGMSVGADNQGIKYKEIIGESSFDVNTMEGRQAKFEEGYNTPVSERVSKKFERKIKKIESEIGKLEDLKTAKKKGDKYFYFSSKRKVETKSVSLEKIDANIEKQKKIIERLQSNQPKK